MSDIVKPRDAKDVEAAVQWALAESKTFEIVGHGSKPIGRAAQWDLSLDLSGLSGVTLYEPEELILSARAGTPIAEIEALLAANNQELAFEPMDYGPVFGGTAGRGTIGGVLAANLSGPRRIKAGAARDHFLGVTAVSGRGETFKSGGRVVKNVTGYDLCKLLAGSWGTLAAMTDVTVKVLPRAETEQTLLVRGLDDAAAARAMSLAMGSVNDVSGAAHLPAPVAASIQAEAGTALTALRLEGVAPSVAHRRHALEAALKSFGEITVLEEAASRAAWKAIRDVRPFAGDDRALWRISTANGFQILCEGGLLPGVLMRNSQLKFLCRDVYLRVERSDTPFTRGYNAGQVIRVPVAHGEGNYIADDATIARLEGEGRVLFRYASPDGKVDLDWNHNGSINAIAGIVSERWNILGMMPHPENHVEAAMGCTDGRGLFAGLADHFARAA